MNYCIYLKKRKGKPFCKHCNKEITFDKCKNCKHKEYKQKKDYKLKQRTYKLAKLEKKRFSILTDDLTKCIVCGKSPINLHEIFGGSNRHNSIKYGLVIPLCTAEHHSGNAIGIHADKELDLKWKQKGQLAFMRHYNKNIEDFINIFGKNYLD